MAMLLITRWYISFPLSKMVIFHGYLSLPEGKPPFLYGFSYGFPIFPWVFLWFYPSIIHVDDFVHASVSSVDGSDGTSLQRSFALPGFKSLAWQTGDPLKSPWQNPWKPMENRWKSMENLWPCGENLWKSMENRKTYWNPWNNDENISLTWNIYMENWGRLTHKVEHLWEDIYGECTISIYSSHVKMIHPTAEIVWFVHARYGKNVHDMPIGFSSEYDKWICQQILSVLPAKWWLMFEYTYYLSSFSFAVFACPSVEFLSEIIHIWQVIAKSLMLLD